MNEDTADKPGKDIPRRTPAPVRARTGRDLTAIRETFSRELDAALDRLPAVPPRGVGRVAWLARRFGVGETAPRKWLSGVALPAMDKFVELIEVLGVSPQRLLRGVDPTFLDLGKLADTRALQGGDVARLRPVHGSDAADDSARPPDLALSQGFIRQELYPQYDGTGSLGWTTASSDDMVPAVRAGDRVLFLRRPAEAVPGGIHLLRFGLSPQLLIRRLRPEGEDWRASCDNPPPGGQEFLLARPAAGASLTSGLNIVGLVLGILRPTPPSGAD